MAITTGTDDHGFYARYTDPRNGGVCVAYGLGEVPDGAFAALSDDDAKLLATVLPAEGPSRAYMRIGTL